MEEKDCPLQLSCAMMGLAGGKCENLLTCSAVAGRYSSQEEEPDPPPSDELCDDNPNIFWTCEWVSNPSWNVRTPDPVTGWFWKVGIEPPNRPPLAEGYAEAVHVELPVQFLPGCIKVIRDREVLDENGALLGHYAKAERNPNFWLELEGEPITLIEWLDVEDPTSIRLITTAETQYCCDVQKDGTLLLERDECGDSVQGDYWLAPGAEEPHFYGDRVRAVDLPLDNSDLDNSELKKLLESAYYVNEILYCQICEDCTYEDRYGASECGHLRYIEHVSSWGGCGYAEENLSEDYKKSFAALVAKILSDPDRPGDTVEVVLKWLKKRDLDKLWWLSDRYQGQDDLEPALQYFNSLTRDTPQEYFERAVEWIAK